MIRIVIENILLFLMPTLIYLGYVYVTRQTRTSVGNGRVWDEAPLFWLFLAGSLLVVVTLIAFGSTSGGRPGQSYEPPAVKDGHIEPGHIQ
jgi:hypothetical protein